MLAQHSHQPTNLRFTQVGRRTAAPMHLADLTPGKQRRPGGDFLRQHRQIVIRLMRLTRHLLVAAAEVAQLVAKRDMDI